MWWLVDRILFAIFDLCAWALNRYQLKEPW